MSCCPCRPSRLVGSVAGRGSVLDRPMGRQDGRPGPRRPPPREWSSPGSWPTWGSPGRPPSLQTSLVDMQLMGSSNSMGPQVGLLKSREHWQAVSRGPSLSGMGSAACMHARMHMLLAVQSDAPGHSPVCCAQQCRAAGKGRTRGPAACCLASRRTSLPAACPAGRAGPGAAPGLPACAGPASPPEAALEAAQMTALTQTAAPTAAPALAPAWAGPPAGDLGRAGAASAGGRPGSCAASGCPRPAGHLQQQQPASGPAPACNFGCLRPERGGRRRGPACAVCTHKAAHVQLPTMQLPASRPATNKQVVMPTLGGGRGKDDAGAGRCHEAAAAAGGQAGARMQARLRAGAARGCGWEWWRRCAIAGTPLAVPVQVLLEEGLLARGAAQGLPDVEGDGQQLRVQPPGVSSPSRAAAQVLHAERAAHARGSAATGSAAPAAPPSCCRSSAAGAAATSTVRRHRHPSKPALCAHLVAPGLQHAPGQQGAAQWHERLVGRELLWAVRTHHPGADQQVRHLHTHTNIRASQRSDGRRMGCCRGDAGIAGGLPAVKLLAVLPSPWGSAQEICQASGPRRRAWWLPCRVAPSLCAILSAVSCSAISLAACRCMHSASVPGLRTDARLGGLVHTQTGAGTCTTDVVPHSWQRWWLLTLLGLGSQRSRVDAAGTWEGCQSARCACQAISARWRSTGARSCPRWAASAARCAW